jgi:hypothetical protein
LHLIPTRVLQLQSVWSVIQYFDIFNPVTLHKTRLARCCQSLSVRNRSERRVHQEKRLRLTSRTAPHIDRVSQCMRYTQYIPMTTSIKPVCEERLTPVPMPLMLWRINTHNVTPSGDIENPRQSSITSRTEQDRQRGHVYDAGAKQFGTFQRAPLAANPQACSREGCRRGGHEEISHRSAGAFMATPVHFFAGLQSRPISESFFEVNPVRFIWILTLKRWIQSALGSHVRLGRCAKKCPCLKRMFHLPLFIDGVSGII